MPNATLRIKARSDCEWSLVAISDTHVLVDMVNVSPKHPFYAAAQRLAAEWEDHFEGLTRREKRASVIGDSIQRELPALLQRQAD